MSGVFWLLIESWCGYWVRHHRRELTIKIAERDTARAKLLGAMGFARRSWRDDTVTTYQPKEGA